MFKFNMLLISLLLFCPAIFPEETVNNINEDTFKKLALTEMKNKEVLSLDIGELFFIKPPIDWKTLMQKCYDRMPVSRKELAKIQCEKIYEDVPLKYKKGFFYYGSVGWENGKRRRGGKALLMFVSQDRKEVYSVVIE